MPPPADGFAARFVLGPALRTQPDRRLVTLVREGYESAFEEIVRRYGSGGGSGSGPGPSEPSEAAETSGGSGDPGPSDEVELAD